MDTSGVFTCSVAWCLQPTTTGMVYFDMPLDEEKKQKWLENLSLTPPIPNKFFVCSSHFADDAFMPGTSHRKLKENALPSCNYILRPQNNETVEQTSVMSNAEEPQECICRVCMLECQEDHKLLSVPENLSLFESLTGVDMIKSDYLPNALCSGCFDTLVNWKLFKKKCHGSNEQFAKKLTDCTAGVACNGGENSSALKRRQIPLQTSYTKNRRIDSNITSINLCSDINDEATSESSLVGQLETNFANTETSDKNEASESTPSQNIIHRKLDKILIALSSIQKNQYITNQPSLQSQHSVMQHRTGANLLSRPEVPPSLQLSYPFIQSQRTAPNMLGRSDVSIPEQLTSNQLNHSIINQLNTSGTQPQYSLIPNDQSGLNYRIEPIVPRQQNRLIPNEEVLTNYINGAGVNPMQGLYAIMGQDQTSINSLNRVPQVPLMQSQQYAMMQQEQARIMNQFINPSEGQSVQPSVIQRDVNESFGIPNNPMQLEYAESNTNFSEDPPQSSNSNDDNDVMFIPDVDNDFSMYFPIDSTEKLYWVESKIKENSFFEIKMTHLLRLRLPLNGILTRRELKYIISDNVWCTFSLNKVAKNYFFKSLISQVIVRAMSYRMELTRQQQDEFMTEISYLIRSCRRASKHQKKNTSATQ